MATKMNSSVQTGMVLEDFSLVSYDEDMGRMLARKVFDDGSEWVEPIAITIPDLFFLFKKRLVNIMNIDFLNICVQNQLRQ